MENRWIFLTQTYEGLEKKGVNLLYGAVADRLDYVLPIFTFDSVTREDCENANVILVGKADADGWMEELQREHLIQIPQKKEAYSIYVGPSIFNGENQMIVVAGFDGAGVLYGCADFCNKYMGDILYRKKNIWTDSTYDDPFHKKLNPWQYSTAPTILRRALWTWGHVIYDYRGFFENMAKLRLNEVVLWNDVAPLNAKDVVDYAHSLNIKVIWGFAWGWDQSCKDVLERYSDQFVAEVKRKVLETYENEYRNTGADGIYFQTVTEHSVSTLLGKPIAQIVTELVNDIAGSLLEKYPDLHIQFGLHATSVRDYLTYMKNVDERIHIVWEDCGSFPYEYDADSAENFEETLKFTKKTLSLRGKDEKWGAVFKGMLKLDWRKFRHFSEPYLLGERTESYIRKRQTQKDRIWKLQQAGWMKNAELLRRTVKAAEALGNEETVIQALVEDAIFENKIAFPVALYAEMLWNPENGALETVGQVSKYPCVNFSNV